MYLSDRTVRQPTKQQSKWLTDLSLTESAISWKKRYTSCYYATNETKLRSFQVKLNMRAIVTNIVLHGFGIKDTEQCTFCNVHREILFHLFCSCSVVTVFWENVSSWINAKLQINFTINFSNMLFGVENCENILLNFLLLCARFLIYRCKVSETKPNIHQYLLFLQMTKKTEHFIAKKNKKVDSYYKKWGILM